MFRQPFLYVVGYMNEDATSNTFWKSFEDEGTSEASIFRLARGIEAAMSTS